MAAAVGESVTDSDLLAGIRERDALKGHNPAGVTMTQAEVDRRALLRMLGDVELNSTSGAGNVQLNSTTRHGPRSRANGSRQSQ